MFLFVFIFSNKTGQSRQLVTQIFYLFSFALYFGRFLQGHLPALLLIFFFILEIIFFNYQEISFSVIVPFHSSLYCSLFYGFNIFSYFSEDIKKKFSSSLLSPELYVFTGAIVLPIHLGSFHLCKYILSNICWFFFCLILFLNEGQAGLYSSGLKYSVLGKVVRQSSYTLVRTSWEKFNNIYQQYLKLFIAIITQSYFQESTFGKWPRFCKRYSHKYKWIEGCLNPSVEYYAALKLMHRINV